MTRQRKASVVYTTSAWADRPGISIEHPSGDDHAQMTLSNATNSVFYGLTSRRDLLEMRDVIDSALNEWNKVL